MLFRRIKIAGAKSLDNEIKAIAEYQMKIPKAEIKKDFEAVKARVLPELMKVGRVAMSCSCKCITT